MIVLFGIQLTRTQIRLSMKNGRKINLQKKKLFEVLLGAKWFLLFLGYKVYNDANTEWDCKVFKYTSVSFFLLV